MRSLYALLALILTLPAAAQPVLTWEPVGDEPRDSDLAYAADDDGALVYGGVGIRSNGRNEFATWRLPPPHDASTSWEDAGPRVGGGEDWTLPLGRDTLIVQAHVSMYRSTDGGQTWERRGESNTLGSEHVLTIPAGLYAGRIVVATGQRNALFSSDRGATWETAFDGGGVVDDSVEVIRAAAVASGPHAGRLVGVGLSGVTTSDDGGLTWDKNPNEWAHFQQNTFCVAALRGQAPSGGDRLITLINDTRVLGDSLTVTVSDDGGDTWQRGPSVHPGSFRSCVEAVDLGGGRAVAVMKRGPIWGTEDGGATWTVWSEFLGDPAEDRAGWAMVDPEGRLIVGLYKNGIGPDDTAHDMRTVERLTPVAREPAPAASGAPLHVSPNPSSGAVRVALDIGTPEAAWLTVFDARGRAVYTHASGARTAHAWEVNTAAWAAGVYVARAEVRGEQVTARFTVAR